MDLVFCEDQLRDGYFTQFIRHKSRRNQPVIVISRQDNWDGYLRAMRLGAFDYLTLPAYGHEVEYTLYGALQERRESAKPSR